jgi:nicotinamide-nucleotide amidase
MDETRDLAGQLLEACRRRAWRIATAESCTGGLIAGALTDLPGSSDVVEGGIVSYSNQAKTLLLSVPAEVILRVGAVSAEVAAAMAEGALARLSAADLAIAVTGIAGPGGATPGKPVGLVHFGLARRGVATQTHREVFSGDRDGVRRATVLRALGLLLAAVQRS